MCFLFPLHRLVSGSGMKKGLVLDLGYGFHIVKYTSRDALASRISKKDSVCSDSTPSHAYVTEDAEASHKKKTHRCIQIIQ